MVAQNGAKLGQSGCRNARELHGSTACTKFSLYHKGRKSTVTAVERASCVPVHARLPVTAHLLPKMAYLLRLVTCGYV